MVSLEILALVLTGLSLTASAVPVLMINEWYENGVAEASKINKKTIERISNYLKSKKA